MIDWQWLIDWLTDNDWLADWMNDWLTDWITKVQALNEQVFPVPVLSALIPGWWGEQGREERIEREESYLRSWNSQSNGLFNCGSLPRVCDNRQRSGLFYLPFSISLSLSLPLSIDLSLYLYLSVFLSISLSFFHSLSSLREQFNILNICCEESFPVELLNPLPFFPPSLPAWKECPSSPAGRADPFKCIHSSTWVIALLTWLEWTLARRLYTHTHLPGPDLLFFYASGEKDKSVGGIR